MSYTAHPTAVIDEPSSIGAGTKIWHFCHVMPGASVGRNCVLGQNVYVASTVRIGSGVRIQNNVALYDGVILEDYVFCGPSCVFTNVSNPRAEVRRSEQLQTTVVRRGATIGANATIVCGTEIGRYAFIAAGAVVKSSRIPDYALMRGVPAVMTGWMSRHGRHLTARDPSGALLCPESGWRYLEDADGRLRCLDWPEERELDP